MLPVKLYPLPPPPPTSQHLYDLEIYALRLQTRHLIFQFPTDQPKVLQAFLVHCALLPNPPSIYTNKILALLHFDSPDIARQYTRYFSDFCNKNFSSCLWTLQPSLQTIPKIFNRDSTPAWILSLRQVTPALWHTFDLLSQARFRKFITPPQHSQPPSRRRGLSFDRSPIAQIPPYQEGQSFPHTLKSPRRPLESTEQTPGYSPQEDIAPSTPQQTLNRHTPTAPPLKQQRTYSQVPDPFDDDAEPLYPSLKYPAPPSPPQPLPNPTSPELAPEQHYLHEDSDRITPLAHAESLPNTSPSSPQQHSPDPASLAPQSKLCQTAPPCLTDLFEELLHDIPGLHEDPLPPVNTLPSSPQMPHEAILHEPPHKQQRTRAPSLSPSDDEEASEKEATLDQTQAQARTLSSASDPPASRPQGWENWSRSDQRNWKRHRNKKSVKAAKLS